jgi:predicted transposase YdaD
MLQIHDLRETRVYQDAKEEGRAEGKEEGKEEGKREGKEEGLLLGIAIAKLIAKNMSAPEIASSLGLDVDVVRKAMANGNNSPG